ncbi:hypothetical protein [Rubritalea tangerina]
MLLGSSEPHHYRLLHTRRNRLLKHLHRYKYYRCLHFSSSWEQRHQRS